MAIAWLAAIPALLAIPATWMGHRRTPGVRAVKTAVTLALTGVAVAAVVAAAGGATAAIQSAHREAFAAGARAGAVGALPVIPAAWLWLIVVGMACTAVADWLLAPVDNSATFVAGLAMFLLGYLLYAGFMIADVAGYLAVMRGSQRAAAAGIAVIPPLLLTLWQYTRLTRVPDEL